MAEEQVVVFRLGKEEYAIPISQVREIIQYNDTTKLPNTPDYMEGVINLRGKVIPVIKLAVKFGLTVEKTADRRAVVIETADQEIGVVVDEVTEVVRLQHSAIEPVPAIAANYEFIRGIGKESDRLLILLDLGKLFEKDEIEAIQSSCVA